jgi:hypothetical protein
MGGQSIPERNLPLIQYIILQGRGEIRKLSYTEAFLMFQLSKILSLPVAVIVYLNFIFYTTPLIHNCFE